MEKIFKFGNRPDRVVLWQVVVRDRDALRKFLADFGVLGDVAHIFLTAI